MRIEALSLALVLTACSAPLPPHAPAFDAAGDAWRPDVWPLPRRGDAATVGDTSTSFDSSLDAPSIDTGDNDAGPPLAITLDGLFTDPYWSAPGASLTNGTIASTVFDGDELTILHYGRDDDWFYLGFEGALVGGDAVVINLDTHFGDGVQLSTGLGDGTNAVNAVLSLPLTATAEFQPEYGWGTSALPHVLTTGDATLGWRTLAATPSHFTNVTANTRSVCSATGCETAMLLAQIGVPTGGGINLVVRLGRPGVGFSNQTFPMSDTATPELVDVPVSVPLP